MERFRTGIIGCGRVASLLEEDPLASSELRICSR